MSEEEKEPLRWYTRFNGEVAGPFPSNWVLRDIRKGRLGDEAEVSLDRDAWYPLAKVKAFAAALTEAREPLDEALEARHEQARHELLAAEKRAAASPFGWLLNLTIVLLLAAGVLYAVLGPQEAPSPDPDCGAAPGPGLNWESCSLQGTLAEGADLRGLTARNADLQGANLRRATLDAGELSYANLAGADFGFGSLRGTRLVGATLTGASFGFADLAGADLSYANLRGARLEGANLAGVRLDKAIWTDGSICAPDSLGTCKPLPATP